MRFGPSSPPNSTPNVLPPNPALPVLRRWQTPVAAAQTAGVMDRFGAYLLALWAFLLISRTPELILQFTGSAMAVGPFRIIYPLVLVLLILSGGMVRAFTSRVGIALFLMTAWFTLSVPFSLWRGGSARWLATQWMPNMLTYAAFAALALDFSQWRRIGKAIGWATPVIALVAFLLGRADWMGRVSAESGTLANANELAALLLLALPFWINSARGPGTSLARKLIVYGSIPFLVYLALRTGSRSGVLSLGLLFVMFLFQLKGLTRIATIAAMGIFSVVATAVMPANLKARLLTFLHPRDEVEQMASVSAAESTQLRKILLMASIEGALTNPLLGVGPGLFTVYSGHEAAEEGQQYGWRQAHNTYTQIATEGGFPALGFFLAALILSCRNVIRVYRATRFRADLTEIRRDSYAFLISFTGVAFFAAFDTIHHIPTLFMLFGLAGSLSTTADPLFQTPAQATPPSGPPPIRPIAAFSPTRTL